MGYDKPDLAFCIHLGSPASPVAYYQQVGRAGRALDDAIAVLVPGPPDERIWEYFATSGIPTDEEVERILDGLGGGPQSLGGVEAATGIRRGRLETLLKILAVDEVVTKSRDGWEATGRAWYFDEQKWSELRRVRAAEADLMRRYAHGEGCLMEFLQRALDDPDPGPCGRCSVCDGRLPAPGAHPSSELVEGVSQQCRRLRFHCADCFLAAVDDRDLVRDWCGRGRRRRDVRVRLSAGGVLAPHRVDVSFAIRAQRG